MMSAQMMRSKSVCGKDKMYVEIKCKFNTDCNFNFDFCSYISEHLAWH